MAIKFEFTARQTRIVRSAVVTGVVLGALGIGVVVAAPPHTFAAGDALRAAHLNDNFNDLDSRIGLLETVRTAGATFSAGCNLAGQTGGMTVVNNGLGDCSLVFATGTFAEAPTCIGTSYGINGAVPRYVYSVKLQGAPTTTTARFIHLVVDTSSAVPNGSIVNEPFGVVCVGRK